MPLQSVILANHLCLTALLDQLKTLSDKAYCRTTKLTENSIGTHVRHIIEHYQELASGQKAHAVCYDDRSRNRHIERSRETAIDALQDILFWLQTLTDNHDHTLLLTAAVSGTRTASPCISESSLVRELLFLQSHTVHHQAVIAILLKAQSINVPSTFGVAPATLQYREKTELS